MGWPSFWVLQYAPRFRADSCPLAPRRGGSFLRFHGAVFDLLKKGGFVDHYLPANLSEN